MAIINDLELPIEGVVEVKGPAIDAWHYRMDSIRISDQLRKTRANMIGTSDEEHYFACLEGAERIDRLSRELAAMEVNWKKARDATLDQQVWIEDADMQIVQLRNALRSAREAICYNGPCDLKDAEMKVEALKLIDTFLDEPNDD